MRWLVVLGMACRFCASPFNTASRTNGFGPRAHASNDGIGTVASVAQRELAARVGCLGRARWRERSALWHNCGIRTSEVWGASLAGAAMRRSRCISEHEGTLAGVVTGGRGIGGLVAGHASLPKESNPGTPKVCLWSSLRGVFLGFLMVCQCHAIKSQRLLRFPRRWLRSQKRVLVMHVAVSLKIPRMIKKTLVEWQHSVGPFCFLRQKKREIFAREQEGARFHTGVRFSRKTACASKGLPQRVDVLGL